MKILALPGKLYRFFLPRRKALFAGVLVAIALSAAGLQQVRLQEDIAAMLPDGHSRVARDFALLQQAPFAQKVIVSLAAGPEIDQDQLLRTADAVAAALSPPFFSRAISGPGEMTDGRLLFWLAAALPNLVNGEELAAFAAEVQAEGVDRRLEEVYARLLSPEGWVLQGLLRRDPLGLQRLGLEKLRHLNLVPEARLAGNNFLSADGRHALVVAEASVALTDSAGAEQLLAHLDGVLQETVPEDIRPTVISGHRYTAANSQGIKRDLFLTLGCALLGMAAIFLIYLRSWRALFVFLIPVVVVGIAAVTTALFHGTLSAITLGFGAVLLGISVDFGLHVYFALRHGGAAPETVLTNVARPVIYGGTTTIAAFTVLLFSELPGQRQLAVFAIVGLGMALLLSLLVLPHLIQAGPEKGERAARGFLKEGAGKRNLLLAGWALLLVLGCWQASNLRFNGDLRTLSLIPADLRSVETELQSVWGNMRGRAMVFAEGADLEQALVANDALFAFLSQRLPLADIVSIAPILPAAAAQEANRRAWADFWQRGDGAEVQQQVLYSGRKLGFSEEAFAPFISELTRPAAPVTVEGLHQAGLGEMAEALIIPAEKGFKVLTLIPDSPQVGALFAEELPVSGVHLVSQSRFGEEVSRAIGRDFLRFILSASLLVTVVLAFMFRSPRRVFLALVPVITGLVAMFGIMAAVGLEFTLLNVVATILIIGLGVDYGIFMVCKLSEGRDHATDRAVLVSGLTTIAGFGALVLAKHPALHSIGITVLLGIGAAIPAALLVIPALFRSREA